MADDDVRIEELVFDYAHAEFETVRAELAAGRRTKPVPPRQYFSLIEPPKIFPPLPRLDGNGDYRFPDAVVKDPDAGYPFGLAVGLYVEKGTRFIRALSFCRRRRKVEVKGYGRMLRLSFRKPRPSRRPFAIGAQCHFGLGLFVPERSI